MDAETAGLVAAAKASSDRSEYSQSQDAAPASRPTADVDGTVADLASSTVTAALQALSYAPASSSVVIGASQVSKLGVDDELSGLIAAAAASTDESDHKHNGDRQPSCITADTADAVSDPTSSAVVEAAQPDAAAEIAPSSAEAFVQQSAVQLSSLDQHADPPVATSAAGAMVLDREVSGLAPSEDAEPAERAMLSLDAEMSGLAPQEDTEPAEHAMPDPHDESETALSDSYEDDTFDDMDPVPAAEAVEAAAVSPDILLDSIYEADTCEAAEEADNAAAEEPGAVMPERPLSPVAMQLAVAAAATATAAITLHDKSAPASLAGDKAVIIDQVGDNDDGDVFKAATAPQTDTKSEDGLVRLAQQPAGDEEEGSEAESTASSDLDDVTQAEGRADAEQAFDTRADESHENEAFSMEAEQSELQTEDSQAQASGELSSSGALPTSAASAAHASAAMASAPQPPPSSLGEVRRPARPSRAFIRHAISLTQPDAKDSSRAGPPAAAPMPALPQAPAGNPPRHRWVWLFAFPLSCALCKSPHAFAHFGVPVAAFPVLADNHFFCRPSFAMLINWQALIL